MWVRLVFFCYDIVGICVVLFVKQKTAYEWRIRDWSSDVGSSDLMYPKYFAQEFPDSVKVLALHAHNAGLIHTREKQVKTMDDLKGLRIRSPSPQINAMLQQLGATPVGLPPGDVYENMQRGVIDGAVFPWDPINSFRLFEVTKYHLDARSYTASFYFVMNKRKYDGLPADVRKAIDDTRSEAHV